MRLNAKHEQLFRQSQTCQTSADFLLALSELQDTEVAIDLRNAGFNADHARKLLQYSYSKREWLDAENLSASLNECGVQSSAKDYLQFSRKEHDLRSRQIWIKASSIAANLGNSEICLEHFLLVLLHKHRTHAYKIMTILGINQDPLLNVLNERMRLKAKDETT